MAITYAKYKDTWFGDKRAKIYEIVSDGSTTSVAITPGVGYTIPIGNYTGYTESAGAFTITFPAGTNLSLRHIMFVAP